MRGHTSLANQTLASTFTGLFTLRGFGTGIVSLGVLPYSGEDWPWSRGCCSSVRSSEGCTICDARSYKFEMYPPTVEDTDWIRDMVYVR